MSVVLDRYHLRRAQASDEAFLREMLYHAIFVPKGQSPMPRTVVHRPDLARYVAGWGRDGDEGLIAMVTATQEPVGAAWFRCWEAASPGYGFVDLTTPELSVAVLPVHRGAGAGTLMLQRLIMIASTRFTQLSLSCDPANPAWNLYRQLGFWQVRQSHTMVLSFPQAPH